MYEIIISGTAYTANETATHLFHRYVWVWPVPGLGDPFIQDYVSYDYPTPLDLDVAPGGSSNIGVSILGDVLNNAFANIEDQTGYSVSVPLDHFSFVPTVSSFDLPVTTNLFDPVSGGLASRSSASEDNSVVSPYSQQPEFNQEHVTMNVRIADILVDELMSHPTAGVLGSALTAGQTYNFGKAFSTSIPGGILSTPRKILPSNSARAATLPARS
jgi:hypothetical protein